MEFVELQKVYSQHDEKFIDLLNSVRNNTITEKGLAVAAAERSIRNSSKLPANSNV